MNSLTENEIELAKGWLNKVCLETDAMFEEQCENCTLVEVNPRLVNQKQMIIIYYNLKHLLKFAKRELKIGYHNCKRLIVQGVAGTGKSQVIKILTRIIRRMFATSKSVLNVAPTGAAAVLLPNGGTIHSLVNIPRRGKDISSHPMSVEKLKSFKSSIFNSDNELASVCINADERSMVGQYTLAWFHQRFPEILTILMGGESDVPFTGKISKKPN